MATITIDTAELDSDKLGVLLELLSNDAVSTNGHVESAKPAAKSAVRTVTAAPKGKAKAVASASKRRTVVAEPEEEEELLSDEDDETELEGEEDEGEEEDEEDGEGDGETVSQTELEAMSLADVKKICIANGLTVKPNAKKADLIATLLDEAGV